METETLLKLVLVLVAVWLVVDIALEVVAFALGPLRPILGIVIIALIVLHFLD